MFTTYKEYLSKTGLKEPERDAPIVVRCTECEMTMVIRSASVRVDEEGYIYCKDCTHGE